MTDNLIGFILACCFWANLSSALFGPYVAGQRNRSMAEGFFFGLFFGPLGLIIVACLPTVPAAASSGRVTEKPARFRERRSGPGVRGGSSGCWSAASSGCPAAGCRRRAAVPDGR